jgi:hypothetical protein
MSGSLQLALAPGERAARMYVTPAPDDGWIVRAEVDGADVACARCSTWQRVERLRRRLERAINRTASDRTTHKLAPFAAAVFLAGALLAPSAAAQPIDDVNLHFQTNLTEYLALRSQLRQGVAREHIIDEHIREISGALLAARIRQARANAVPGDIIPMGLADTVRDRLHRALDPTEVDVLLMNLYANGVPTEQPRINAHYDDAVAVAPPVAVLSALPPVPGVLGYRLLGQDLVLWDEEAEIVIDVINGALPDPRIWRFLDLSSFDLRERIQQALTAAHLDPWQLVDDMARDTEPGLTPPEVDEPFDWDCGAMMPPSVLHALPALPVPLEYRFVGSDLVVVDVQSGFVRGILRDVLPRHVPRSRA